MEQDSYRPLNGRRRLLIVVLAVATAVTVVLTLLARPGGAKGTRPDFGVCQPGQTEGCVGGKATVLAPAAAAASAALR